MPILSLSCAGCWEYFSCNWARALLLGVCDAPPKQLLTVTRSWKTKSLQTEKHGLATAGTGFSSNTVAPYIYQWALMTACALLVMNVQVATRYAMPSMSGHSYWPDGCIDMRLHCAGFCQPAQHYTGTLPLCTTQRGTGGSGPISWHTSAWAAYCFQIFTHGLDQVLCFCSSLHINIQLCQPIETSSVSNTRVDPPAGMHLCGRAAVIHTGDQSSPVACFQHLYLESWAVIHALHSLDGVGCATYAFLLRTCLQAVALINTVTMPACDVVQRWQTCNPLIPALDDLTLA